MVLFYSLKPLLLTLCLILGTVSLLGASRVHAQPRKGSNGDHSPANQVSVPTNSPSHILVAKPADLIDQDSADDRPCFTLDGRMMYFGSRRFSKDPWRRPDANPQWKWDSDLWYRILTDTGWSRPINVGIPINNSLGQLNPTVSPRGDELYYVGENPVLWKATMLNGKFQQPKPVGGLLNKIYDSRSWVQSKVKDSIYQVVLKEVAAGLDSDLRLRAPDAWQLHVNEGLVRHYKTQMAVDFVSTIRCETSIMPDGKYGIISENFGKKGSYGLGGEGGEDLWLITANINGAWDSVMSFNGNINTEYDETYPFMAADGVTLYFTSNRPCKTCPAGSTGHQDLYRTRFDGAHWTDPVPLGPPFNSSSDDYGFSIGPDGKTAYFVSNRNGPSRLYQVELSSADSNIAPKPVVILQGRVTDATTHKPIRAEIFIDDLSTATNQFSVFSDSVTGNYILAAQRGHRFGIQAIGSNHLPHSDRITIPADQPFDRKQFDLELTPETVGASLEFKNVYFDFSKATLLDESKLELDRVTQYLSRSIKTSLTVAGHTDDVGTAEANQELSEARAKVVMDYLVSHGVKKERLKAVGYGKSRPIAKGRSESDRARNRRVEMTITSQSD